MTKPGNGAAVVAAVDPIHASTLSAGLQQLGYTVAGFASVDQALADLKGSPPAIIVCGLSAPELDGWRLCRVLRSGQYPAFQDVPILLVSESLAGGEAETITIGLGGNGLLPLPVEAGRLGDAVRRLVREGAVVRPQRRAAKETEGYYGQLFSNMLDACALHEMIWDAGGRAVDYRFLAVNPQFERITGTSSANILGKTVLEIWPDTEKSWIDTYGRVALTGEPHRFESHHAGLNKDFEVVAFRPAAGQFACVFSDITDRKEGEKQTLRINHLNEFLGQVNQAIVRAGSRQELLESTCRIATRHGRFRLTWIGWIDEGTGAISFCAQDSDPPGIPGAVHAGECAVCRRAIEERRPIVCNAVPAEQQHADCHVLTSDVEIRSCGAFPIRLGGNVCGIFCVHSTDPEFFQVQEIRLLEEIALDVSFALDKFESENARREVEERFAAAFEHFPAPAAISTVEDGVYLEVNRQFETVFGFSRAEALGTSSAELRLLAPERRAWLAERLVSQGRLLGEELELRAKDGRLVNCLLNVEPITVNGQRRLLSVMLDVTQHKQIDRALQASEETLRRLCDRALDGIVMIDEEGRAILWNPAAAEMFGYSAAEVLGQPIHEFLAPPQQTSLFQEALPGFQKTGHGGLIGRMVEVTARRRDGTEFPMELSLASIQRGDRWQAVGIIRDVTTRYEARMEIEAANHRYHSLAEQGRTIIWEMDPEGLFTYVSHVCEAVLGYLPEELVGKKRFYELSPSASQEAVMTAAGDAFAAKEHFRDLETPLKAKDGGIVWVSSSGLPYHNGSGALVGYHGSSTDITSRKRAEEEGHLIERRYRSLFENMLNGFAYCKMLYDDQGQPDDFVYLEVNAAFARWTGLTDVVGKRISEILPGLRQSSPEIFKTYGRVAASGESERFEFEFQEIGRWLSVSVYSPETGYFVALFDDITERKERDTDRETVVALLRLINAPNDTRQMIQAVTALLREWSGCAAVGVRLHSGDDFPYYETRGFPAEFVEAENYLCARDECQRVLRDTDGNPKLECMCGNILCGRFDPRRPFFTPGGSFWTNSTTKLLASTPESELQAPTRNRCNAAGYESVALVPLRSSARVLGLLQFNDFRPDRFTPGKIAMMERAAGSLSVALEQRNTRAALMASEERYRVISENTADVIWMADARSCRFTFVSPRVQNLLGYQPEEMLTKELLDPLATESRQYARIRLEETVPAFEAGDESLRTQVHRLDQIRRDGTLVQTEVVTTLLTDQNGRVSNILGVTRDITERVQAETRLMQAQKMESVGRLAGGVAHDFNNLLTVINGYSRLMLEKLNPSDPLRESLEEIHKAGTRGAGLTQQLLAFSRKQVLRPRLLDLNRVVGDMQPMLARLLGEDVDVRAELHSEPITICADPHQLEQVVMNLAVNSRDAMPRGGSLLIETSVLEWGESLTRSHPGARPGRYVMLAISDTGGGMDEATRRRMFEPFFTTKEVGKGTGLGLSMVLGIVEQSGGYLEAYSEIDHGTTIKIYLPNAEDATSDSGSPQAALAAGGTATILVVEDQEEVRRYAAAALRTYGYNVLQARSASEALQICEQEQARIRLVLTDVVMPNRSGRVLAYELWDRWPAMKVLFMSGYTDDAIMLHGGLETGMEFIQKPFSPDQLAGKVGEMLAEKATSARVVVADDEAGVRRFFRIALEQAGYQVIEAENGKQALTEARTGGVELVITDLVMPEKEGIETIQALRKELPGIGIIAVSGAFGGKFLKHAQMLGADAVLCKPVETTLLIAKVVEVLHTARARARAAEGNPPDVSA